MAFPNRSQEAEQANEQQSSYMYQQTGGTRQASIIQEPNGHRESSSHSGSGRNSQRSGYTNRHADGMQQLTAAQESNGYQESNYYGDGGGNPQAGRDSQRTAPRQSNGYAHGNAQQSNGAQQNGFYPPPDAPPRGYQPCGEQYPPIRYVDLIALNGDGEDSSITHFAPSGMAG
jgi:hypothetical protein